MHMCLSLQIFLYMVKGVHRLSQRSSYVFESNSYSYEGLCKLSQSSAGVVWVK